MQEPWKVGRGEESTGIENKEQGCGDTHENAAMQCKRTALLWRSDAVVVQVKGNLAIGNGLNRARTAEGGNPASLGRGLASGIALALVSRKKNSILSIYLS